MDIIYIFFKLISFKTDAIEASFFMLISIGIFLFKCLKGSRYLRRNLNKIMPRPSDAFRARRAVVVGGRSGGVRVPSPGVVRTGNSRVF